MSLALYVVLDAEEPGFDVFVDGKAVAHAVDELDALCDAIGLPGLDTFVGEPTDELDDAAPPDEGEDEDEPLAAPGHWFDAAEGVAWLQALVEAIEEQPEALEDAEGVLEDLGDIQHVLEQAQAARLRWHFAWDF